MLKFKSKPISRFFSKSQVNGKYKAAALVKYMYEENPIYPDLQIIPLIKPKVHKMHDSNRA